MVSNVRSRMETSTTVGNVKEVVEQVHQRTVPQRHPHDKQPIFTEDHLH